MAAGRIPRDGGGRRGRRRLGARAMKLLGMMVVVAVAVGLGGLGGLLRAADEAKPPTVVKQKEDGGLTLLAIDASVHGRKAKLEKKGANPHNIGYWTDVK